MSTTSKSKTMIEGPLAKQILLVSLPLALSNLLQILFNMSDVAVVGRFAGSTALGSVGSTATFVTLFTGFLIGLSNGVNVLVARFYGAGHPKDVSKTVHSALLVSLAAGVLLLFVGLFGSPALLELLNTKEDLLPGAILYLRVYFLGMPALALYNFGNAVFSAIGETKKPLAYLSFAGVLNILLNLFFRHRLQARCRRCRAGQHDCPVRLGRADPARADKGQRLLCAGFPQGKAGPQHDKAHPDAGRARGPAKRDLCDCQPLYSGGRQLLRLADGQGQLRRS
ncbi:MAG: MATE family efflux transporter [Gemmiger formicilis]|uniref:MATE family efflux transporter n=1 Tax=Gemmiger formicilis TaxID=745368 RepID=UPI003A1D3704